MLTRAERLKLFRMVSLVREWLGLTIVLECARRQGDLRRVESGRPAWVGIAGTGKSLEKIQSAICSTETNS